MELMVNVTFLFFAYVVFASLFIDISTAVIVRRLTPKDRKDLDVWSNAAAGFGGIAVGLILVFTGINTLMILFGTSVVLVSMALAAEVVRRSPIRFTQHGRA